MGSITIGLDIDSGQEARLGELERLQGTYILGKSGMGKSTLIESMILQDIEAGRGVGVLDPHGDLIDGVLAQMPSRRADDVILLDPADDQFPFGLNLFGCEDVSNRRLVSRVATQAVEVFKKLWGESSWGPQLEQTLRNCAYTLIANPGHTLAEMRLLLLDSDFRTRLTANLSNPQVLEFWNLEYNPLRPQDQRQRVASTLNKVDEFLGPVVHPIVGFGRSTIDFREVMDQGRILLIRLPVGDLTDSTVSLLGSVIVGQILNAALSRQDLARSERRLFTLYADEYHRFATPSFAELLTEARKYAVATTLAHQFRRQLEDDANRGATLSAANLVVFAVNGEDADELAKQFDRTPPRPPIAGQRARLSISQDPVGHLTRSGHANPKVRHLTAVLLQPLVQLHNVVPEPPDRIPSSVPEWAAHAAVFQPQVKYQDHIPYRVHRRETGEGINSINKYLVHLMEHDSAPNTLLSGRYLSNALLSLRGYIGFAQETLDTVVPETLKVAVQRFIRQKLETVFDFEELRDVDVGFDRKKELIEERTSGILNYMETRPFSWSLVYGKCDPRDAARAEVSRIDRFAGHLFSLGTLLYEEPVYVDSGQWIPIYESPRSYNDVEAEIASDLVSLGRYHVRCRLLQGSQVVEQTLKTPEFQLSANDERSAASIAAIRARTREKHCAPLAEVLRTIELRHRGGGSDDGPTQRRVALG